MLITFNITKLEGTITRMEKAITKLEDFITKLEANYNRNGKNNLPNSL